MFDDSSNDQFYSRIVIQSIMFLNRCFNETKRNYWFIELKIVDIVWMMKKIRHMIELTNIFFTIIYIDHFVAVFIFRQITLITFNNDKLNLRFVRASQYFFDFNLSIRHKIDKINVISNALFKLQADVSLIEKIDVLKSLYNHSITSLFENLIVEISVFYYHVALIEMSNDFKLRLKQTYKNDEHWLKILDMIRSTSENRQSTSINEVDNDQLISVNEVDNRQSISFNEADNR